MTRDLIIPTYLNVGPPRSGRTTLANNLMRMLGASRGVLVKERVNMAGKLWRERVESWRQATLRAAGAPSNTAWDYFTKSCRVDKRLVVYDLDDDADLAALLDAWLPHTVEDVLHQHAFTPDTVERIPARIFASTRLYRSSSLRDDVLSAMPSSITEIGWSEADRAHHFLDWWSDTLQRVQDQHGLTADKDTDLTPTIGNVRSILSFIFGPDPIDKNGIFPVPHMRSIVNRCEGLFGSFDPVLMRAFLDDLVEDVDWSVARPGPLCPISRFQDRYDRTRRLYRWWVLGEYGLHDEMSRVNDTDDLSFLVSYGIRVVNDQFDRKKVPGRTRYRFIRPFYLDAMDSYPSKGV
jgi:hypothetical protein